MAAPIVIEPIDPGERERNLHADLFRVVRKHIPEPNERDKQIVASLLISLSVSVYSQVFLDRELAPPEHDALCGLIVKEIYREIQNVPRGN